MARGRSRLPPTLSSFHGHVNKCLTLDRHPFGRGARGDSFGKSRRGQLGRHRSVKPSPSEGRSSVLGSVLTAKACPDKQGIITGASLFAEDLYGRIEFGERNRVLIRECLANQADEAGPLVFNALLHRESLRSFPVREPSDFRPCLLLNDDPPSALVGSFARRADVVELVLLANGLSHNIYCFHVDSSPFGLAGPRQSASVTRRERRGARPSAIRRRTGSSGQGANSLYDASWHPESGLAP